MDDLKEILVETTGGEFPAHTYYLNKDGKLIAFKRAGEETVKEFSRPLMFDKRKRTFEKVKA